MQISCGVFWSLAILFSHNFRITYRSLRTYILRYVTLPLLASKSQELIPSVGRFLIKIVQLVLFKLFCCWFAFLIIPFSLQSPFSLHFFVCKFLFCCLINNNSKAFLSHIFLRRENAVVISNTFAWKTSEQNLSAPSCFVF